MILFFIFLNYKRQRRSLRHGRKTKSAIAEKLRELSKGLRVMCLYRDCPRMLLWTAVSIAVMLILPWLTVTFVKSDGAMAACCALFFGINPVYSLFSGIFAGKNISCLFGLPVFSAALFLLGTSFFSNVHKTAFLTYAVVYLLIGTCAMLVSAFVCKKHR